VPRLRTDIIVSLSQLIGRMLDAKITIAHSGSEGPFQGSRWQSPSWIRIIYRKLLNSVHLRRSSADLGLPYHNRPRPEGTRGNGPPNDLRTPKPCLMSCVHRNWERTILLQGPIDAIKTDREFFTFLQAQVRHRRSRLMRILSCRYIVGIHFTKVPRRHRRLQNPIS